MTSFRFRIRFLLVAFVLLWGLGIRAMAAESGKPDGWPVFRGNSHSTGVAHSDLPDQLDIEWQFRVPGGSFESSPAIVKHALAGGAVVYIADLDGSLFALDLTTGKKQWEAKRDTGFVASPAVRNGKIYLGDLDGKFHCFDSSGQEVWKFESETDINGSANFFGSQVLIGSQDGKLYSLDADTGKRSWAYQAPDQIQCSMTVAGGRVFVAGCDGQFHVVDAKNGQEIGNTNIGGPTGCTPAVLGDRAFFGTEQGEFFSVDWKKIQNSWSITPAGNGSAIRSCAATTEEHVIFGARNRQVYSLDPRNGKQNWTVRLKANVHSSPVVVGQRVFVASTDGRLYSLDLKTGAIKWQQQFNGGFRGSPAIAFGHLVIATDRGVVYCLGRKDLKMEP